MPLNSHRSEEYELLLRTSSDSPWAPGTDDGYYAPPSPKSRSSWLLAWNWIPPRLRQLRTLYTKTSSSRCKRWPYIRLLFWTFTTILCLVIVAAIFTAIFLPSYTNPPSHYKVLEKRCLDSSQPGRGNVNNEKIFVAAALYDPGGALVGGDLGNAVLQLVELLGPENVYLSVYENDADSSAIAALESLKSKLRCNSSLVSEHLPLEDIPHVTTPTGERRIKRIAFLAEVRNRALRPLEADPWVHYDKLLFINDVLFNPIDAIHLLFSTNIDTSGRTQYGAACAVDFINAFKFYDRFATRDFDGYAMGIPFFPWFTNAGGGISRREVLDQKDAVRVRACWGGMAAFEAKWFLEAQPSDPNLATLNISPLRFRYEEDPFWEASECCLIHADLTYLRHGRDFTTDSGIITNSYIRVAYDSRTLSWLPYTRRVERLYSFVHNTLNHLIGMPFRNPRRLEEPGDEVVEKVWGWDKTGGKPAPDYSGNHPKGSYHDVKRVVGPGRFCGGRALLVLNDDPKPGEKTWIKVTLPAPPA
ncbi:glycosyltransferase family 69 protein [Zopfia rhizophila CBS 207.26]|uniref:Glycosyltransferase family 69 protein n=1 Tax=Zopfia rhizophila CBS 207.26 TaxID=1314779 RepID=A0A6A6ELD7_9PEZI|nr:glycosyltransferase family 69 protein [Zopfia rhizophila CBS 207.26]